jgi:hypothetical protein
LVAQAAQVQQLEATLVSLAMLAAAQVHKVETTLAYLVQLPVAQDLV